MADISLDQFVSRIKTDIHAPSFIILPVLYDILRDFTERTWIIYKTFEQQCTIDAAEYNDAIAIPVADTVSDLVPIKIDALIADSTVYTPLLRDIVGVIDREKLDVSGVKFYNFFSPVDDPPLVPPVVYPETNVRIFPWDTDPLITVSIPFRTGDAPATVPSSFLEYKEAICSGVIARLMLQPGKDWTNPSLGMARDGLYQDGVSKGKNRFAKINRPVNLQMNRSFT